MKRLIPAQWKVPIAVLLRWLEEDGRQAPVIEVDRDGSVSMGWYVSGPAGEPLILSLRPECIALSVPRDDDWGGQWVRLGEDWMSEVRRLAPRKDLAYS